MVRSGNAGHLKMPAPATILGQNSEPKQENGSGFGEEISPLTAGSLRVILWRELPRARKHSSLLYAVVTACCPKVQLERNLIFRYGARATGTTLKPRLDRADNRQLFYTGFNSNSFRSVMSKAILEAPTILPAESLTGEIDKDTFLFR